VQSRARKDAIELHQTKNNRDALKLVVEQVKLKTKEEKEHANRLEQGLTEMYNRIPIITQVVKRSAKDNINLIAKIIDHYK
jgi:hypothetical protein